MPSTIAAPTISVENIYKAKVLLREVAIHTPLMVNHHLSEMFQCQLYLKREDMQVVRSYKIRGAYNKMAGLSPEECSRGVVCASAGNHAQGFALACQKMQIVGKVYMPAVTPQQKIRKVKHFGKEWVEVILTGDTFDDAYHEARQDAQKNGLIFIHPFDDERIIEGQATVGLEILEDSKKQLDYVFVAIGGGGLISGLGSYFKRLSPKTKIIGVEPAGAPAMYESFKAGEPVTLHQIDSFVDGAAVRRVGDLTFKIAQQVVDDIVLVPEGKVCSTILQLYNEDGIVVEPAGALTVAALDAYKEQIKGKQVVCVLSGSNNDITRTEEIRERSLLYEGLKHYFLIRFPQRAGALREFLNNILGPNDDITHFEYTKKHNRESGPAMVGIQVEKREDYEALLQRMDAHNINYQTLNDSRMLFELLV
ncbi:MAG TPA: threonine ammonia-lyase [Saprospiraceae bacterium]|nr:threonine ammonia-lyase [Saprospiraceae bacterium]HMQ84245.1 threonine ammonia-lyase [Saprospiraceae bacterium]